MAEIGAICEALGEAGTGVLQIVLNVPFSGWGEELEPVIAIAEKTGRPLTFTLGLPNQPIRNWGPALDLCDAARARGIEVWPQLLPRPVGMVSGWDLSTNPFCLCPSYLEIADLPLEAKLEHLRDPAFRERLLQEEPAEGHPLAMMTRDWDWIFPLNFPPDYEPSPETSMAAQAAASGQTPQEIAYDQLMNGGEGDGMLYIALGNLHEGRLDEVHDLMQRDDVVLGLGDGGAHYSAICDASYTTWMLTHWIRDRQGERLGLGHAIHHLAARPAQAVGLLDRGLLRPGYKADVNVIDQQRLSLHKPVIRHDLPGGGRRLDQGATGYVATICGGEVIRRNDQPTGTRPGKLVRGAQAAPV
jgi:N-acyl-D-aspartate/D-glutamate deacylase